ncbi:MAG: ATP-binding protein [Stenotrophobium sp.]
MPPNSPLAYRWRNAALQPLAFPQAVRLADLLGIDRQKNALLANTRQFVRGLPANHVLLTGSRGTGKSSLVKALLTEFAPEGLRLVEVHPHDLADLPDIVAPLRGEKFRFVLYVDDFSVASNDPALVALKTALDGGIEDPPENVLIYATSNRRHLMPEQKRDNQEYHWVDDELHPGESTEEKISLSERFGLWLSFPPFDQTQYLEVVRLHLQRLGVGTWDEEMQKLALRWALNRASRSGRVAQQFARDLAGRLGAAKN